MGDLNSSTITRTFTARERWSWILVDFGNSAFSTTILAAVFPVYLPSLLPKDGIHFVVGPFAWTSTAMSLWGYTVSASLFLTFLISPLLGAWADEGAHRKRIMGVFTVVGALATMMLGFVGHWAVALGIFVVANMGFSGSCVFYNSLLSSAAEEKDWHKVSLEGFAWGYVGGGLLLAFNLLLIMKYSWFGWETRHQGLEWSFFSVGIWWLAFTLPSLFILKEDPPQLTTVSETDLTPLPAKTLGARFADLWVTAKSIPAIPFLLLFMLSFAFYNDAISTVISMSTIFGKEALSLDDNTLIGTLLMIQFLGLPFTLLMIPVAKRIGAKKLLIGSLIFWCGIVFFAFRMTQAYEFWILGIMVSIVLGVSQSLPRSIFASLIPRARQSEFFSFFALSGKMTSILGPLLFAIVRDVTGNARLSILSLGILFILGLVLLCFVKTAATVKIDL